MKKIIFIIFISIFAFACSDKKKEEAPDVLHVNELIEKANKINEDFKTSESKFEARKAAGDTIAMDWEKLNQLIPDLDGYERTEPKGMLLTMDNSSYSNTRVTFKKGYIEVDVSLYDYNMAITMFSAVTTWRNVGFNHEDENGYQKVTELKDVPDSWIFEEWNKKNMRGTVTVSLNDRYFLQVGANDQKNSEFVKSIAMEVIKNGKRVFSK